MQECKNVKCKIIIATLVKHVDNQNCRTAICKVNGILKWFGVFAVKVPKFLGKL